MDSQNLHWMVNTHGNPLGALQTLLGNLWQTARLDGMLVPLNGVNTPPYVRPRLVWHPAELAQVNPFKPLMTINSARLIPELLQEHPGKRIAVLLRPCEMRALVEMVKHAPISLEDLLTITVDCLGTFPLEDYLWRLERKGSSAQLTEEALHFARQGGIQAYRYRAACQYCISPGAHGAQVNIGVLGLPVRQVLTISLGNPALAEQLDLAHISDGPAAAELVAQRGELLTRLAETHQHTRARILDGLAEILPSGVAALVEQFDSCGDCQLCLDSCPICEVDFPQRGADNRFIEDDVARWLVSCAGCGMCEQVCPNHKPLSTVFTHIRELLDEQYGYTPGISVEQPLPVIGDAR